MHTNDLAEIRNLYDRVEFARAAVNTELTTAADASSMPEPWDLFFLGRVPTVMKKTLFYDYESVYRQSGIPGLRDRLMATYGMQRNDVKIIPSWIAQPISVTNGYINHLPEMRSTGAGVDEDHILYAPLTPSTISDPDEIFYVRLRDKNGKYRLLYVFLRAYSVEDDGGATDSIYHCVLAFPDGVLRTSHRLNGGATAFLGKRRGKLLYAAYV